MKFTVVCLCYGAWIEVGTFIHAQHNSLLVNGKKYCTKFSKNGRVIFSIDPSLLSEDRAVYNIFQFAPLNNSNYCAKVIFVANFTRETVECDLFSRF